MDDHLDSTDPTFENSWAPPGEGDSVMKNQDAQYNLLMGIFALHMSFVDRDAFVQAVGSWVTNKSEPLDQILRKKRLIDKSTQEILRKLVLNWSDQDLGDSARPALPQGLLDSVRRELSLFRFAEIDTVLSQITNSNSTQADPYATRLGEECHEATTGPDPTGEAGRFPLLRLHARGGMGEVFVARDDQLNRNVALKQLQDRYADHSESRLRFLLEARITGYLEHPGIVPVYGIGRYVDGRPYYAMRFVEGSSLKEEIDSFHGSDSLTRDPSKRSVEFRKLLGRFQSVCYTIAFAHNRGVLHRDIKPANIMIGSFGETLVVDWGLAKTFTTSDGSAVPGDLTIEGDRAETLAGLPLGTPPYMSPEQAAGQIDRLGPASDVYSLGATLYHLLTGRAPFDGDDFGTIIERVRRGQFAHPKKVERTTPEPLAMICLKAMSLSPEDRYATPQGLAEDIDHWLAGEPVTVYRDWMARRIWRWGRVHPWVVGSVGIITFFVIALFLLSAFVLAIPGVLLALLGGMVGSLAGAFQGKMTSGAKRGSALAFRIGIVVGAIFFILGISYEAFVLPRARSDRSTSAKPVVGVLDAYSLSVSRWNAGDPDGSRKWYRWAEEEFNHSSFDAKSRNEIELARTRAASLLHSVDPTIR